MINIYRSGKYNKSSIISIESHQCIVEMDPSGVITSANDVFCNLFGYNTDEIQGKKHSLLIASDEAGTAAYQEFWNSVASGASERNQYKRIAKDGQVVWLEGSYTSVLKKNRPVKIIMVAMDITQSKELELEQSAKLAAISISQAMIEFDAVGNILTANENFCNALGYQLSEIVGKHHRIFCEPTYVASPEYREFWRSLGEGHCSANEFMRLGKSGNEVWIQATYNPIMDAQGKVTKVIKLATDVTPRMNAITQIAKSLHALAEGDLTRTLDTPFVPTMERIRLDFNEVLDRLRSTMRAIEGNASSISANANEILAAADDLSHRTEKQAASVEQTASALEEITTTVTDANQRAAESAILVSETRLNAEESGQIVSEAVSAMSQIEKSANEISNIISVIDDIAFQTNLLALNAGVEAARAGETGKGFAVVAQEVRELAQRSANAAKEIKDLIVESGTQVTHGVSLVGKTGVSLKQIVKQIQEIDEHIQNIATSSREQSIGIKEISEAVSTIDQGTQQNAAMVEQSTASSHSLAAEAAALFELLSKFELGAEVNRSTPKQRPERFVPTMVHGGNSAPTSPAMLRSRIKASIGGRSATTPQPESWTEF